MNKLAVFERLPVYYLTAEEEWELAAAAVSQPTFGRMT